MDGGCKKKKGGTVLNATKRTVHLKNSCDGKFCYIYFITAIQKQNKKKDNFTLLASFSFFH